MRTMPKSVELIRAGNSHVNMTFEWIARLACFGCMALVGVSTLTRYVFNSPIGGTDELTIALLTLIIFASITFREIKGGHVRIEMLYTRLTSGGKRWLDIVRAGAQSFVFAMFVWGTSVYCYDSWVTKEVTFGVLGIPVWIIKIVIVVGCVLFFFQSLGSLVQIVAGWRQK